MVKDIVSRIRRNHGLEHATIHVLTEKHGNFSAQGNSNHRGFMLNIYGDIGEEAVVEAVNEAFRRMKGGEHDLAVHPNCGTVLLTTATLATLAAQVAFGIEQKRQHSERTDLPVLIGGLPSAILAAALSLVVSRPIGLQLQRRYTTEGDLGDMQLLRVRRVNPSLITRFFKYLLTQNQPLDSKSYMVETIG